MNKHLLFTIVVLLFSILAKSQTNVSGNIPGNTTWTKDGSPYILTGNVGVRTGYTLIIEPGVTIERDGDYQILINGAVQINGTAEDSIQFVTNKNPVPEAPQVFPFAPDNRPFVEFQKSNLDNSSLSYISFQQSNFKSNDVRVGNESQYSETNPKNSGTLNITHSNLSNGYITPNGYRTQAHLAIDSCIMSNGFINNYSGTEDINISNSRIVNSIVWSNSFANGISFTNCYLGNNQLYLMSNTTILNSTFENNKGEAFGGGNTTIIKNSEFINTYITYPGTDFDISDSKFTVDDKLTDPYGNEIQDLIRVNHISTRNTQFVNNTSYNINGITIYGDSGPQDNIIHNQFTNWYDAITVNHFGTIQLDSNYFSIPGRYDIVNNTTKDFSALYNQFQLKNGQNVDDVIFDQNDDLTYGLVTYTPYEIDPIVLPVTALHFSGTATEQAVKLSWQVNKDINIANFVVER